MDIKIPFLGDGIAQANVLSVMVNIGDKVSLDQTLIELETDKAVAPVPATSAGTVKEILIKAGDLVKEGQAIVRLDGASSSTETATVSAAPSQPVVQQAPPVVTAPAAVQSIPQVQILAVDNQNIVTTPLIRRFASLFKIDLRKVAGTGSGGRITLEDVQRYLAYLQSLAAQPLSTETAVSKPVKPVIDFAKFGPIRREKVSSLRQKIADKMVESWQTIPHVTQFDEADITNLMELRKKYNAKFEKKYGVKMTVTSLIIKALPEVLKEFPIFNSSLDESTQELVYKEYVHLGIAVDTASGLIVPVLKDADKKNILEQTKELQTLAEQARDRKLGVNDLQGASFTISNLGSLGVGSFTPIVNGPQVAILGLSKGNIKPVYNGKTFEPRLMFPLSLSYDHRVIDGADAARFMRAIVNALENFNEAYLKEI